MNKELGALYKEFRLRRITVLMMIMIRFIFRKIFCIRRIGNSDKLSEA